MLYLELVLILVAAAGAVVAAGHALLNKRDPRAAMGWIGFCLVFPLIGALSYFFFGINRIRTRARKLHDQQEPPLVVMGLEQERAAKHLLPPELRTLVRISDAVSRHALVSGNTVELLHNGEETYPRMLEAIDRAESSLLLASYIFDGNATGQRFIDALARASERGVSVNVLLDGYGEIYSSPRAGKLLRRRGVRLELFLPPKLLPPTFYLNLRNHRKILVVDGDEAFVGGMNIGDRHLVEPQSPARVVDTHFRLTGSVVAQIAKIFCEDWEFATGESLVVPTAAPVDGNAICRTITDGPNEDLDRLAMILVAAVAAARRRVVIMTPYFLPSREMIAALQAAALRGVEVEVILPEKNNLIFMHWATRNLLWELLERGVRIFYQPPPFVHSKLFLIDDHYTLIGSANLDPRSLRLNFELTVEVFDAQLAAEIAAHCAAVREVAHEVTFEEIESRSIPERLRDGFVWLFSPYL